MPDSLEPFTSIDPDVDLHVPKQQRELAEAPLVLLSVIAVGGAVGALGRYGASVLAPSSVGELPRATIAVNVIGCFFIGVVMTVLEHRPTAHRLLRPFVGVGLLGGFTTFSTYTIEVQQLLAERHVLFALSSLFGTVVAALGAVAAGMATAQVVRRSLTPTGTQP